MTPPKDFDRLAENLFRERGEFIQDERSFNKEYTAYLNDLPRGHLARTLPVKRRVFSSYARQFRLRPVSRKVKRRPVRRIQERAIKAGQIKGRIVRVTPQKITRNRKRITIFRDARGRFASTRITPAVAEESKRLQSQRGERARQQRLLKAVKKSKKA